MELNLNTNIKSLSSGKQKKSMNDFGTSPLMYVHPTIEGKETKVEFNSYAKELMHNPKMISVALQHGTNEPYLITGIQTEVTYPVYNDVKNSKTCWFRNKPFINKVAKQFELNKEGGFYCMISLAGTTVDYNAYKMTPINTSDVINEAVAEKVEETVKETNIVMEEHDTTDTSNEMPVENNYEGVDADTVNTTSDVVTEYPVA